MAWFGMASSDADGYDESDVDDAERLARALFSWGQSNRSHHQNPLPIFHKQQQRPVQQIAVFALAN